MAISLARVAIIGGGPAGLYAAGRLRGLYPRAEIVLFEQNPSDATWGFGVVFSDQALDFLRDDDPDLLAEVLPLMERWQDMTLNLKGEQVRIDGVGFSAVGRLALLQLLQKRLDKHGINLQFGLRLDGLSTLAPFDLVIGADGVNSTVRQNAPEAFPTTTTWSGNRFIWYGTPKRFETLTQSFVEHGEGFFNAHHYRYSADWSTFIVECDAHTYERLGISTWDENQSRLYCETIFKDVLQGAPLVSNRSMWRRFPWIQVDRWHNKQCVLVGDAAHTAHFSIGSGTRLAIEDVLKLTQSLQADHNDLEEALFTYEAERRPQVMKLVEASRVSALWYESFPAHMAMSPIDFAYAYITRSGRVSDHRLSQIAPEFYRAWTSCATRIPENPAADPTAPDRSSPTIGRSDGSTCGLERNHA